MRDQPKWAASRLCPMRRDSAPTFLEMVRAQYQVERLNRRTGECSLISIDEAIGELVGFHTEPLEFLIQRAVLPTPSAFYRLHVQGRYVN